MTIEIRKGVPLPNGILKTRQKVRNTNCWGTYPGLENGLMEKRYEVLAHKHRSTHPAMAEFVFLVHETPDKPHLHVYGMEFAEAVALYMQLGSELAKFAEEEANEVYEKIQQL